MVKMHFENIENKYISAYIILKPLNGGFFFIEEFFLAKIKTAIWPNGLCRDARAAWIVKLIFKITAVYVYVIKT
jgi:hypothetical protein